MDTSSAAPVPQAEKQEQAQPSANAPTIPPVAPSFPMVGVPSMDAASAALFNPFAAAAIAAANQQMAQQLMQSQKVSNAPAGVTAQPVPTASAVSAAPSTNEAPTTTSSSASSATAAPVAFPQAAAPAAPSFTFTPQQFASLLGAPTLAAPAAPTTPAPAAAAQPVQTMPLAAAAAQVVAAQAAAATSGAAMANAFYTNMQHWKLDQLESHVQLLRDSNQPIPQPVALLLADARRKEEKRTAKRVANRRSACSSRARKKALVEEMSRTNARLRRQAMILALLPDLVIAITVDGKITFCSAQVERVLRHPVNHLVGANVESLLVPSSNVESLLVPSSREKLRHLVRELISAEQAAMGVTSAASPGTKSSDDVDNASDNQAGRSSGMDVNPVSDQSFPLSIVNLSQPAEENSDLSTSANGGGKTTDAAQLKSDVSAGSSNPRLQTSSDDSFCSTNDAKNLRKANEHLGRNVRWHNEKLASQHKSSKKASHKDDVTGASVTANNAGARLSSLQHRAESPTGDDTELSRKRKPARYDSMEDQESSSSSDSMMDRNESKKKSRKNGIENASDDSGYRESNESLREDTSSDDSSSLRNAGPRPKPLAPACNVCLIRDDLTTIWCEVTSSIRTRSLNDDMPGGARETMGPLEAKAITSSSSASRGWKPSSTSKGSSNLPEEDAKDEVKELLLCLRPIRDGDERVDESLRFVPPDPVSEDLVSGPSASSSEVASSKDPVSGDKARPPKKRPVVSDAARVSSSSLSNESGPAPAKKIRLEGSTTEKSVAESLMLMGNNAN